MLPPNIERRRQPRYDFPDIIEYVVNLKSPDEPLKAVTLNISNSGLCLYVFQFLSEGQEIIINSCLPLSFRRATTRWIKKIDDDIFYMVGLMAAGKEKIRNNVVPKLTFWDL